MRIATWNVNSLRARIDLVLQWTARQRPDVLCLQETKVTDDDFPTEEFQRQGYSIVMTGEKSYNGVAILAKGPLSDVEIGLPGCDAKDQKRVIAATVNNVRILSCYVPNGKSLDHPDFKYKLDWFEKLHDLIVSRELTKRDLIVCGDFNVARDERDLFDPKAFAGQTHFHPLEHAAMAKLEAAGLQDVFRRHEARGGIYSWWDYRGVSYRRNLGLRIDYIYASPSLAARSESCIIDREERSREKPSDHVPVLATFGAA